MMPMSGDKAPKITFADLKPYAVPETLDELEGPDSGIITLPREVWWQPGGDDFDLDDVVAIKRAYRAVISEGNIETIRRFLNKELLIALWPDLALPNRLVPLWERRFPELGANWRYRWTTRSRGNRGPLQRSR